MSAVKVSSGASQILDLHQAKVGDTLVVERIEGQSGVCHRLREMGFCEQAVVRKLADHGNLICTLCGTRLAISRELAKHILVKKLRK